MSHPHTNLVQQSLVVDAQALGTLAGRTALSLNTTMAAIQQAFLMKRFRYLIQLVGRTTDDDGPLVLCLARGDASLAEVAAAMIEQNTIGREDTTQSLTEDESWVVFQNSVVPFVYVGGNSTGVPAHWAVSPWVSMGGKNGIVATEENGWSLFVFNAGSGALSTGSSLNGICQIQGVWLRD